MTPPGDRYCRWDIDSPKHQHRAVLAHHKVSPATGLDPVSGGQHRSAMSLPGFYAPVKSTSTIRGSRRTLLAPACGETEAPSVSHVCPREGLHQFQRWHALPWRAGGDGYHEDCANVQLPTLPASQTMSPQAGAGSWGMPASTSPHHMQSTSLAMPVTSLWCR